MRILFNANIYAPDFTDQHPTAMIIDGDKIVALGNDVDILNLAHPGTLQENIQGKTIWPGLTDSHIHFLDYSLGLSYVFCETETKADCLQNVAEFAAKTEPGKWILGWGWNHNIWEGGFGNAADLDTAAPNNPVFLQAKSGHAAWANSKAMQLAGISKDSEDPSGGVIVRDHQGNPTGIFFENAMSIIGDLVPDPSLEDMKAAVKIGQESLWKMGLTGVHDFSSLQLFKVLQDLQSSNELKLRVTKGIPLDDLPFAAGLGISSGFGNDLLRIGSVKLFSDGALGPQTAAMLEPFENSSDKGILLLTAEQLFEYGKQAAACGLSLAVHAIGDLANREMLDGYEKLREYEKENHLPNLKHRIEHVQLLHPQDFYRLAKLDITASVQPIHNTSDIDISDRYWGKRAAGAYAFRTLLDQKTTLIFGSDAPVETPNPFIGLHAAVTRRRANGYPGANGWYPEQRIHLVDALKAYSFNPAEVTGCSDHLGKLAPGYLADLIVLDADPFTVKPETLHEIKPAATMVAGEWVWQEV